MRQMGKNASCEKRIHDEIIVDANGSEEQAMGWYYYLQDTILSRLQPIALLNDLLQFCGWVTKLSLWEWGLPRNASTKC